ncbi:MAG: aldehyde:ferredoxin oxidoreductase [bacterium]|nr:aldehyde:ferredoxin oxidoreductase [bacterium]
MCMCEVEVNGERKLVTTCNFPVVEGMTVNTETDKVNKHRRVLAEMYLSRWPNVPTIKKLAKQCGVTESRFEHEYRDENRKACILCGKCKRACSEFTMEHILDFAGRGVKRHMTMPFNKVDPHCVACTSCGYVCPTGAIQVLDDLNHPASGGKIRRAGMKVNAEMARLDDDQCRMRQVGTANIVDVMDKYDLLPVKNYMYGSHEETWRIDSKMLKEKYFTQGATDGCWPGCSMACAKGVDGFELKTGPYKGDKVIVDGPEYETAGAAANMGCFDGDFLVEFNFYCDTYGVDTISVGTCVAFVMEAFEAGQITTEHTGGMELNFGAADETLELLHQMARGEGFGVDVGQGVRWLKNKWAKEYGADAAFLQDIGMESKGLEYSEYVSKESLAQQCGYTMAIKGPQHDEAWLIFMDMVNNQLPTFEDKAEALHYYPLWRTWFGLLGLCKLCWNDVVPSDNFKEDEPAKIPGHVRGYFDFFEGMTGIKVDEDKMLEQSGRVYTLQKVMCRMLGFGTRKDDMPPYRAVGPVTEVEYESRQERYDGQMKKLIGVDPEGKTTAEKVAILREYRMDQYVKTMDVVYERRGWTKNGVPKISRLKELGIDMPELVEIIKADQEEESA